MNKYMKVLSHLFSDEACMLSSANNGKADAAIDLPTWARTCLSTAAILCVALLSSSLWAQSAAVTTVTGSIIVTGTDPGQITFSCTGLNPCVGTYTAVFKSAGCSNSITTFDVVAITGLDLTRPGPIQGSIVFTNADSRDTKNPDGTCSVRLDSFKDSASTFGGTWNGTNGSFSFPTQTDGTSVVTGTFSATTAVPIQPTPLTTVTGSLSATGIAGDAAQITFACKGENPCTGTYKGTSKSSGCSNSFNLFDVITILGLNLTVPGPIQGEITLKNAGFDDSRNADGTCSI